MLLSDGRCLDRPWKGPLHHERKEDARMFALPSRRSRIVAFLLFVTVLAASRGYGAASSPDWPIAPPDAVGLDGQRLVALSRDIRSGKYSNIHALLMVRRGKLAFEEYFAGADEIRGRPIGIVRFDANTLHDVRSVTKSVSSMLLGVALARDAGMGLDTPVLDFFPEYADLRTPQRLPLRLRHLLSMSAGLKWDEHTQPYGSLLNSETAMDEASDRYRFVLEQPIVAEPGRRFEYSGGNAVVLAAIIERSTKVRADDYARRVLFGPLGITRYEWLKYPDGTPIAASGLRLLPRDMAKLGLLCLNHGRWNEKQVVPEAWLRDSISPHITVSDQPHGLQSYGYQWWRGSARVGEASVPWIAAVGYGGQRILIVPSMDLVVVLTAGLYGNPREFDIAFDILLNRILPAVSSIGATGP
jgi:CubicO group peptidase (beta-lactamase class C family)